MAIQITKEKFDEYEKIRQEGRYNMFDENARALSSLSRDEWITIITDYEKLASAWLDGDKDEKKSVWEK